MPQGQPQAGQGGNIVQLMMSLAAGAGFKNVTEGMKKMAESGSSGQQLFQLPNMPLFLAGAGVRDMANSMELLGPLLKMMEPPAPPEQETDPQELQAAMQMLSARLGGGLSGIQAPGMGGPQGMSMGGTPGMMR
ncbi:MAG TPA: hypothetical protein VI728_09390 [Syntrophales bacterium]|nr:hypothetical protein [Syntrophales bacterium]